MHYRSTVIQARRVARVFKVSAPKVATTEAVGVRQRIDHKKLPGSTR